MRQTLESGSSYVKYLFGHTVSCCTVICRYLLGYEQEQIDTNKLIENTQEEQKPPTATPTQKNNQRKRDAKKTKEKLKRQEEQSKNLLELKTAPQTTEEPKNNLPVSASDETPQDFIAECESSNAPDKLSESNSDKRSQVVILEGASSNATDRELSEDDGPWQMAGTKKLARNSSNTNSNPRTKQKDKLQQEYDYIIKKIKDKNVDKELLSQVIALKNNHPKFNPDSVLVSILKLCNLIPSLDKKTIKHYILEAYNRLKYKKYSPRISDQLLKMECDVLLKALDKCDAINNKEEIHNNIKKISDELNAKIRVKEDKDFEDIINGEKDPETLLYKYIDIFKGRYYKKDMIVKRIINSLKSLLFLPNFKEIVSYVTEELSPLMDEFNDKKQFFNAGIVATTLARILIINKSYDQGYDILLKQKIQEQERNIDDTMNEHEIIILKPAINISVDIYLAKILTSNNIELADKIITNIIKNKFGSSFSEHEGTGNYELDNLRLEMYIRSHDLKNASKLCINIENFTTDTNLPATYWIRKIKLELALGKNQKALESAYKLHKHAYEQTHDGTYYNDQLCGNYEVDILLVECLSRLMKTSETLNLLNKLQKNNIFNSQMYHAYHNIGRLDLVKDVLIKIKGSDITKPAINFSIDRFFLIINKENYDSSDPQILKLLSNLIKECKDYPDANDKKAELNLYRIISLSTKDKTTDQLEKALSLVEDNLPHTGKWHRKYIEHYLYILGNLKYWSKLDDVWQLEGDFCHNHSGTLGAVYIQEKINQYIEKLECLIDNKRITEEIQNDLDELSKLIITTIYKDIDENSVYNQAMLYLFLSQMYALLGYPLDKCQEYKDKSCELSLTASSKASTAATYIEDRIQIIRDKLGYK